MCGIYCSTNYNSFKELHSLNTKRGDFATGHLFLTDRGDYEIERFPGRNNYDDYPTMDQVGHYDIFLGLRLFLFLSGHYPVSLNL